MIKKYKDIIAYLFFGVCTTVINVCVYEICYTKGHIPNVISTIVAWCIAVLFAFITNKLFVFNSKSFAVNVLFQEIVSFFTCRLITGLLDLVIMYIAVDCLIQNALLWKIISNILVIVANYIASKLIIFKK